MMYEAPYRHETPEEFLRRGGRVTRCAANTAAMQFDGTAVVDGYVISSLGEESDVVPQIARASVEHYDKQYADAIRPVTYLLRREQEATIVARTLRSHRMAGSTQIDTGELPVYDENI